jgi:flagellar hook-basal body complex protein FliE
MVSGININSAIGLYQQTANQGISSKTSDAANGGMNSSALGSAGDTFGGVLENVVDKAVESSKTAEEFSSKAIAGEADINDVVMAIANAEMALETVVAVRDKAMGAYQEIMKMSI